MSSQIEYVQIKTVIDARLAGFMQIYRDAFSRAPYFERSNRTRGLLDVWCAHIVVGGLFLAMEGRCVVGLCCAYRANRAIQGDVHRHMRDRIQDCPFELRDTVYVSELAVHRSYEGQGIGSGLLQICLHWAQEQRMTTCAMRTAHGSKAERLYRSYGAQEITGLSQHIPEPQGGSQSQTRIWFWSEITRMLDQIEQHQASFSS